MARDYALSHVQALGRDADLIVISQGGNVDGLPWMEAARRCGYPYVVIAQAAAEEWWPPDDIAERLAMCYEKARMSYFVSEANLALSRRQFVTPLRHARIVRNPFNVSYDAQPPWPGDPSECLFLACVGRLEVAAKGQDLLLQVLSLARWRDRKVQLSFFGEGVNERGLRGLAAALALNNVRFHGFVRDVQQLWGAHHALVLPSRYEGLPLALVEAMLCARASIVTDVAGHRELVRDGIDGFVATAPSVGLLDEALNRAWNDRVRLEEMGLSAASHVRERIPRDPTEEFVAELVRLF